MSRIRSVLLVCLLGALILQPTVGFAQNRVLRLLTPGEPETLDPHLRHWVGERTLVAILLEGLTREDEAGNPIPGAATSWDISPDGLRYQFHLRPDATFSDGRPVTAESFVYAFRRLVDPKTAAEATSPIEPVLHARDCIAGKLPPEALGVETTDPLTLLVTLEQPNPFFPLLAAQLVPLEREVVERWGRLWTEPAHMVSNGPFTLTEFVLHGNVGLAKNPRYWNAAKIHLDRITFVSVENSRTAQRMFAAGEVDAINLSAEEFKDGGPLPGAQLRLQPLNRVYYLFFNMREGPLAASRSLRRALALSLDQDFLQTKILKSVSETAFAMVPSILPGYPHPREDFADHSMPERIAEARRLYAEAGYGTDRPLEVKFVLSDRKLCGAAQEMWRIALGVHTLCDIIEDDHGLNEAYRTGQFDMSATGDNASAPDPLLILGDFRGDPLAQGNDPHYISTAYDDRLKAAQNMADPIARAAELAEAERILLDDQVMIPLSFSRSAYAVSPRVHGYRALATRTLFLDDVTVDQ
jgi:oligopeptide transport system substrate-binding protein